MKRVGRGIVVCTLLAWPGGAARADEGVLPAGAEEAIQGRDWPAVVRELAPLADTATSSSIPYWLAVALANGGKPKLALPHLERAWALDPTDPGTLVMRALVAGETEMDWKHDRLRGDLASLPEISWAQGFAWDARHARLQADYKRAPWRRSLAKLSELSLKALRALEQALEETASEDAALLRRAGFHALEQGMSEKAVAYTKRALAVEPGGWEVHLQLARALTRLGRHDEATREFDVAIASAPGTSDPRVPSMKMGAALMRGQALLEAGRPAEAVDAFRASIRIDAACAGTRHLLGQAAFQAGDLELALWAFGEARELDHDWTAPYWTGRCMQRLGRHDLAERLIRGAIEEADAHDAKAKDEGESYRNAPGEWYHWLARAEWENGKRAAAVKTVLRRTWGDMDLAYARWAYWACTETDDPYGAIQVCDGLGSRQREVAIEGLRAVLAKWPVPRLKDMTGGRKAPHTYHAHLALAKLLEKDQFHTAADHYVQGGYLQGTWGLVATERVSGAWTLLHADRRVQALAAFDAIAKGSAAWRTRAVIGGACAAFAMGRAGEALRRLEGFADVVQAPNADAIRLWAGVAEGRPAPSGGVDVWTLLGVVASNPGMSLWVEAVLPGGAMAHGPLPLVRGDRITRLGSMWTSEDDFARLRTAPVPTSPLTVTIERGMRELSVEIDLAGAEARARARPEAGPPAPAMEGR